MPRLLAPGPSVARDGESARLGELLREAFAALAMVRRNRHAWRSLYGAEQESVERIGEKLETELRRTLKN